MTWIKTIRPEDSHPSLLELLQKTRRRWHPPDKRDASASRRRREHRRVAHPDPEAMHHAFAGLACCCSPGLPLNAASTR